MQAVARYGGMIYRMLQATYFSVVHVHPHLLRIAICAMALLPQMLHAVEPDQATYESVVMPFLQRYCVECHGPVESKTSFRADLMRPTEESVMADAWLDISDHLGIGDMPPVRHPNQPTPEEVDSVLQWIHQELVRAKEVLAQTDREVVLRRLTLREFDNTIRDLLHIRLEEFRPSELLPTDGPVEGFTSDGAARVLTPAHLDAHIEAAGAILRHAVVPGPEPMLVDQEWEGTREFFGGNLPEPKPEAAVWMEHVFHQVHLRPNIFTAHADGLYRVTVRARATPPSMLQPGPRRWPVQLAVARHRPSAGRNPERKIFVVEERSVEHAAEFYLRKGDQFRLQFFNGWELSTEHLNLWRERGWHPHLHIEAMAITGPVHDAWPPLRHQAIFGAEPVEDNEAEAIVRIRSFANRAFRRPTPEIYLEPFYDLYRAARERGDDFETGIQLALQGVLASPHFLYLLEPPDALDDFAIASRLSYFLWSTMPDEILFQAALEGKLREESELLAQVGRMLEDPRADDFIYRFADEWLDVDQVAVMPPDQRLYPEFDPALHAAMQAETRLFLRELILQNLPVSSLIHADFTMANERLAALYGIEGVEGNAMRRVALTPELQKRRGGLLTQAAILNVTSNGTTSSPVVRGVFVLDRILGNHPPPAPPDVPAIEPDIRGATTIREQFAKHREIASCASCHARIDPIGFALESYDVLGAWRDYYRAVNPDPAEARRQPYIEGPPVESADELAGLGTFADITELKALLLEPGPMALVERNFAERLLAYAAGRSLRFADRADVDLLLHQYRQRGGGARNLIEAIVLSEIFLTP